MASLIYQPTQTSQVTPEQAVLPRPALPSLLSAVPATPLMPTISSKATSLKPVGCVPRLPLPSLLRERTVTPSSILSPTDPVMPESAPPPQSPATPVRCVPRLPSLLTTRSVTP